MLTSDEVDPSHTALIVIDVQNDFLHSEGGLARRGRDVSLMRAMVPNLVRFIAQAREYGASLVFVRLDSSAGVMSDSWIERMRIPGGDEDYLCREGSWGSEFYTLQPQPGDRVVVKPRYSAFFGTELDVILRSGRINTLLVTGVTTNVCVETTARDGFQRDYDIVLVEDCCAATSPQIHEAALSNIRNHFGKVVTSDDLIDAWSKRDAPMMS